MEIRQAVHTPHELLNLLPDQPENAVYFLDIHLHSDMDGIELASAIRQKDPRAFIIFYYDAFRNGNDNVPLSGRTAGFFNQRRSELHPADSSLFAERSREKVKFRLLRTVGCISGCPIRIYSYQSMKFFYIEATGAHRITVHTTTAIYQCSGSLNETLSKLDQSFFSLSQILPGKHCTYPHAVSPPLPDCSG